MRHFARIQEEFLKIVKRSYIDPYTSFETYIRGKKFIHPVTRNSVEFYSLPRSMQQMIRGKWDVAQRAALFHRIQETSMRMREREPAYAY